MSNPPSISPNPSTDEKPAGAASPIIARLATGVLLVIVPIMIGGICWRWATVHGPTTAVIVRGNASLEGAEIVVTGNGKTWPVHLARDNNWQIPVLLDPGIYHLAVTHHGRTILNTTFPLDNRHGISYELPSMVWLIGNPLVGDAEIEISRVSIDKDPTDKDSFASMDVRLTPDNHFRTPKYLPPGTYRATARNGIEHRVIAQVEFTVDPTATLPLRVDLGKPSVEGE